MKTFKKNSNGDAARKLPRWAPLAATVILIGIITAVLIIILPSLSSPSKAEVDASVKSDVGATVKSVMQWQAQDAANKKVMIDNATTFAKADVSNRVVKTQPETVIGVYAQGDGSYTVCGFNPKGSQFITSRKAWGFDSITGVSAPVLRTQPAQLCVGAIDARGNDAS